MPKALLLVSRERDESLQSATQRILTVWEERRVFEASLLTKFKAAGERRGSNKRVNYFSLYIAGDEGIN